MSRGAVLSAAFTALLIGPAVAQDGRAALLARVDSVVLAEMARTRTPGMSVAIQRGNDIILARGYGLATVELSVPASAEMGWASGSWKVNGAQVSRPPRVALRLAA